MVRTGEYDRRITIQTFTEAADAVGEAIKTWANVASNPTVWSKVEPLTGRELFEAQQTDAEASTRFTVRHRTDLDTEMRITYDSDNYGIVSIKEIGRKDATEIVGKVFNP